MSLIKNNFRRIKYNLNSMSYKDFIKNYFLYISSYIFRFFGRNIILEIKYPNTNFKFKVNFHFGYWKNLEKGIEEPKNIDILLKNIKKGDIIFDIGAFIGSYTLLFSKLVGPNGKVMAFEPNRNSYSHLKNNINLNKLGNINICQKAMSNFKGNTSLYLSNDDVSNTILPNSNMEKFEKVGATSIDDFCKNNKIKPTGIKIDVEGAEGLVLDGAEKIIKKYKPWILLEFHNYLLSNKIKNTIYHEYLSNCKSITFIECKGGEKSNFSYGDKIKYKKPNCRNYSIFIKF